MSEKLTWLLFDWRLSIPVCCTVALVILVSYYGLSGNYTTESHPWYFGSLREYQGMVLMLTILPVFIILALIAGLRRSAEIATTIDQTSSTNLLQEVRKFPLRLCAFWAFVGFLYAIVVNVPGNGLNFFVTDSVERALILGQIFLWMMLGAFLPVRVEIARAFNRVSEQVHVDIFETTNLKPFARIGLIDVLIVSGAMVLSTVQSLDLAFRPDNYSKALVIAIPAILFLAIYPVWGIHRRMLAQKKSGLDELNQLIREASKNLTEPQMNQLETLLQRRARLTATSSWPVDVRILQRFLFYIVIPPLAWIGAALVELLIEGFISG